MVHLKTIGPASIDVGSTRLGVSSPQAWAALFYLVVERGKVVSRRTFADLLFPDSADLPAAHALRQLVYRLRKMGVALESDSTSIMLPRVAATWDIEIAETRGSFSDDELDALARGYLPGSPLTVSRGFDNWLDDHRTAVSTLLRRQLLTQLREEKAKHRFAGVDRVARAYLALDPLNEEATLAAAEALVMTGSKSEALSVLDRYIDEVGGRARGSRFPPSLLRERISEYVVESGLLAEPPLVGRDRELATLRSVLARIGNGAAEAFVVWGPSGIGKTRLLNETCSIAALEGLAIVRSALQPHDQRRPLSVLRDIAPRLLDLPGALGCSSNSLAMMRGLCGRGEMPRRELPRTTQDSEVALAGVLAAATDLMDAVCEEQSVVVCVEDAHWLDPASLELIVEAVAGHRNLCVLMASQRSIQLPHSIADAARLHSIEVPRLSTEASTALMRLLFERAERAVDGEFIEWATGLADGVPFYLHSLFVEYVTTGDRTAIPATLTASLASKLERLGEPTRSVFDAIVVLGTNCTLARLESLVQLPRHALLTSLRELEERGLTRSTPNMISSAHELFAVTARKKMPGSVARMLHRAAAETMEPEIATGAAEAWTVASHWNESGDSLRGLNLLQDGALVALSVGRPQEAVDALKHALGLELSSNQRRPVLMQLVSAAEAAGDYACAYDSTELLIAASGAPVDAAAGVTRLEYAYSAGKEFPIPLQSVTDIVTNVDQLPAIRLRAARLLLCVAEDTLDDELATKMARTIAAIPESAFLRASPMLIYHMSFGDIDEAIASAELIAHYAATSSDSMVRYRSFYNAGYALFRSGRGLQARDFLEKAFAVASDIGMRTGQILSSSSLTFLHWAEGNKSAAGEWRERSASFVSRSVIPNFATEYYSNAIYFALDEGRVDDAEAIMRRAEELFPSLTKGGKAVIKEAFKMRILMATSRTPSPSSVDTLLRGHVESRRFGNQDLVVDTLVGGLCLTGRTEEAQLLAADYLKRWRRERYTVPMAFLHLTAAHQSGSRSVG